jgi:acetoacetyl-CoA reductase
MRPHRGRGARERRDRRETSSLHHAEARQARSATKVITISPGYIGTKMVMAIPTEVLDTKIIPQIPMGRLGKPEEVAGLVAYLASEEAAFLTGANISINGGQHMY